MNPSFETRPNRLGMSGTSLAVLGGACFGFLTGLATGIGVFYLFIPCIHP